LTAALSLRYLSRAVSARRIPRRARSSATASCRCISSRTADRPTTGSDSWRGAGATSTREWAWRT